MSFQFTADDFLDFSDGDSSKLTSSQREAITRGVNSEVPITSTSASDMGYSSQQSSTISISAMLQGIPQYKDQRTPLGQQDYALSTVAGVSLAGGGLLGSGYDDIIPLSVAADAEGIGPIDLPGEGSSMGFADGSFGDSDGYGVSGGPVDIDRALRTIKHFESSGGDYKAVNKHSNAGGAYQFLPDTWDNYGGYRYAHQAPKEVQDRKAREHIQQILSDYDNNLRAIPGVWYSPAIWRSGDLDRRPDGKGNKYTVLAYINMWVEAYHNFPPTPGWSPNPVAQNIGDARVGSAKGSRVLATRTNTGPRNDGGTYAQIIEWWGPPCEGDFSRVILHGGKPYTVRTGILDAVKALNNALRMYDYKSTDSGGGSYDCRRNVNNQKLWSFHSLGTALDINPTRNPNARTFKSDMPAGMVAAIKRIQTREGVKVWRWGGDYRGMIDTMHFEVVCSPSQLRRGLDPATTYAR